VDVPPTPEASTEPPLEVGSPGVSARREYDKRATRELQRKERAVAEDAEWRREQVEARPVLGRLRTALVPKPTITPESQATKAWKTGAAGEERVAEILATCDDVVALHDRRIPGTKANIDHIAVGPAGVFVIDAKKYRGAVESRDVGSLFRSDVRLYVGGRNQTKLVEGVRRQVELVSAALHDAGLGSVRIQGILCFVEADWPLLLRRPVTVAGVVSVWPLGLPDLLHPSKPTAEPFDVGAAARLLANSFPPA
jgi:hypothetical protein